MLQRDRRHICPVDLVLQGGAKAGTYKGSVKEKVAAGIAAVAVWQW